MTRSTETIDDPTVYGSKGQAWAPEFVAYMKAIVTHPIYDGMPDAVKSDGKIQWEAPSNRSGGQYQYTHNKRRDWWKLKAQSIGIDVSQDQWISRTAKSIHPSGEKPCKRCGKVMQIAYVYPQANLIRRFKKCFGDSIEVSDLDSITDVMQTVFDLHGPILFRHLQDLLATKDLSVPDFGDDLERLMLWLNDEYVPKEPSILSPGAMSNAPDRFDGFHSFNRCCRGRADTGRCPSNMRSYVTDRRVFEYWSEGDWIAADRLMGLVKSKLREEPTADGRNSPPTADHIGPLSLGFCHRPEFKLLSRNANSAKNNRMTKWDVDYLISVEQKGEKIVSWYAKPLWDNRKGSVNNEETALRLSKILRDNQRNAMAILCRLFDEGYLTFLVYLLELGFADSKVEFEGLRAIDFITIYDRLNKQRRTTKYSIEQKARRIRIGFDALRTYKEKANRHTFLVAQETVSKKLEVAMELLSKQSGKHKRMDQQMIQTLFPRNGVVREEKLRNYASEFPVVIIPEYEDIKGELILAMTAVSVTLSSMWNDARYVREEFNLDE